MIKFGPRIALGLLLGLVIANSSLVKAQASADIAVQSDELFGYDDILVVYLSDYSPSGTYITLTGSVVLPGYYDQDEIPHSFIKATELESGTRLPIFGASAIGGRQATTIFTGADSRFSFGIVGGRSHIPYLSLDGIRFNIASCLKPGMMGIALHISDDVYVNNLKLKKLYMYSDAKFLPGKHSLKRMKRIPYDPLTNAYRCTPQKKA